MSKSQAIVFTGGSLNAILVSLDNQRSISLNYPQGLNIKYGKSLNMMSNGPKMYIAAELTDKIKEQVLKQCASRTYELCNDDDWYILTPLCFDSERRRFNESCNLVASAVFKAYVYSLLQYSDNSIIVCVHENAIVFDADTMDQLKIINIKAYLWNHYVSAHIIPGTDFKFSLEFNDSQFVKLYSVETG